MKAITTKYHGPIGARGARIVATDSDGNRASIPYPHDAHTDEKHRRAAVALCKKMKWTGTLIQGGLKNDEVFVWLPREYSDVLEAAWTAAAVLGDLVRGGQSSDTEKAAYKQLKAALRVVEKDEVAA